jgi:hypothetical protein
VAGGIGKHGFIWPAMDFEVSLTIPDQVGATEMDWACNWRFVEARAPRSLEWILGAGLSVD